MEIINVNWKFKKKLKWCKFLRVINLGTQKKYILKQLKFKVFK